MGDTAMTHQQDDMSNDCPPSPSQGNSAAFATFHAPTATVAADAPAAPAATPTKPQEVPSSTSAACLAKGTMLLRHDGSKVAVEDVEEGDMLLGPDGGERKVLKTASGKGRLYRIKFGRSNKQDLRITPEHILMLHKDKRYFNEYEGPSLDDHRARIGEEIGEIDQMQPSSDPANAAFRNNQTRQCDDFHEALRKAVAWILSVERGAHGKAQTRNVLNGTTGISMLEKCYRVHVAVGSKPDAEFATYAWGGARDKVIGHANHPPVFFATKQQAFEAAVAKSREMHANDEVSLANLIERFERKSANGKGGQLRVDAKLPNLSMLWNKYGSRLRLRTYCCIKDKKYARYYSFPEMPDYPEGAADDDDEEDEEDGEDDGESQAEAEAAMPMLPEEYAEVSAASLFEVIEKAAAEFAALGKSEQRRYRLYNSTGFELPYIDIIIDAYFLGLWLGDGNRKNTTIFNNHEEEIRDFLVRHAAELDLHLVHHGELRYATVGKTRLADRPLPPIVPSKKPKHWETAERPAERTSRHTIYKQRLAAGWVIEPRDFGGPIVWRPPPAASPPSSLPASTPPFPPTPPPQQAQASSDAGEQPAASASPVPPSHHGSDAVDQLSVMTSSLQLSQGSPAPFLGALGASSSPNPSDSAHLSANDARSSPFSPQRATPPRIPSPLDAPHGVKHELSSSYSSAGIIAPVAKRSKRHVVLDSEDVEMLSAAASSVHTSQHNSPSPAPSINPLNASNSSLMPLAGVGDADDEFEDDDELQALIDFAEEPDDEEQDDEENDDGEDEDEDDEGEQSDEEEQQAPRRNFRAQMGASGYGDLDEDEFDALIDDIVDEPEPDEGQQNKQNTLLQALRSLGVLAPRDLTGPAGDTKHVPQSYLKNSRAVRLKLLAGFIDADGTLSYPDNKMSFVQSELYHRRLFWDMVAVARSLGFHVSTRRYKSWNPARTERYPYLHAVISGETDQIPCLLIRKQAWKRVNECVQSFVIRDVILETEQTEWAGVQVDEDQLYLRDDYLVLHNSNLQASTSSQEPNKEHDAEP